MHMIKTIFILMLFSFLSIVQVRAMDLNLEGGFRSNMSSASKLNDGGISLAALGVFHTSYARYFAGIELPFFSPGKNSDVESLFVMVFKVGIDNSLLNLGPIEVKWGTLLGPLIATEKDTKGASRFGLGMNVNLFLSGEMPLGSGIGFTRLEYQYYGISGALKSSSIIDLGLKFGYLLRLPFFS